MARIKFYLNWITSGFLFVLSTASPSNHCEINTVQLENGSISRNMSLLWKRSIDGNLHFDFSGNHSGQGLLSVAMRLIGDVDGKSHVKFSFVKSSHLKHAEQTIQLDRHNGLTEMHKELFLDLKYGFDISFTCGKQMNLDAFILSVEHFIHFMDDDDDDDDVERYFDRFNEKDIPKAAALFEVNFRLGFENHFVEEDSAKIQTNQLNPHKDQHLFTNPIETTESTTMLMSTEITPIPNEHEITWKIISLVFIGLTAVLLTVSICLWITMKDIGWKRTLTGTSFEVPRV